MPRGFFEIMQLCPGILVEQGIALYIIMPQYIHFNRRYQGYGSRWIFTHIRPSKQIFRWIDDTSKRDS